MLSLGVLFDHRSTECDEMRDAGRHAQLNGPSEMGWLVRVDNTARTDRVARDGQCLVRQVGGNSRLVRSRKVLAEDTEGEVESRGLEERGGLVGGIGHLREHGQNIRWEAV